MTFNSITMLSHRGHIIQFCPVKGQNCSKIVATGDIDESDSLDNDFQLESYFYKWCNYKFPEIFFNQIQVLVAVKKARLLLIWFLLKMKQLHVSLKQYEILAIISLVRSDTTTRSVPGGLTGLSHSAIFTEAGWTFMTRKKWYNYTSLIHTTFLFLKIMYSLYYFIYLTLDIDKI